MSRLLVVAPYPPRRDGIAVYARAHVERLRREGDQVTVISPPDGDGDVRVDFRGGRALRAAAATGGRADRILVHFQPTLFHPPRAPVAKVAASLSLLWLVLRRRQTEVLVHEATPPRWWRPDEVLLGLALRLAPALLFHTTRERDALQRDYRIRVRARIVPHTHGVRTRAPLSRADARRRLGIPEDEPLFVSPGFIHPDKGHHVAIRAADEVGEGRLVVIGSVREDTPGNRAYLERLRGLAAEAPNVALVEGFLDDAELDAWIAAADAVVLAYRRSWSSGVLARAQMLGTRGIVTAVGGLPEQASERDLVVGGDGEIADAMRRVVAERRAGATTEEARR